MARVTPASCSSWWTAWASVSGVARLACGGVAVSGGKESCQSDLHSPTPACCTRAATVSAQARP
eukprot:7770483-Alexandrium_andersonii.AAC.1